MALLLQRCNSPPLSLTNGPAICDRKGAPCCLPQAAASASPRCAEPSTAGPRCTSLCSRHQHRRPEVRVVQALPAALTLTIPEFPSLIPVQGAWGVWSALILAGAFGVCALVATLAGMFLANVGVLPPGAPELHVVYKYLLPLAIPMLLFSADLRRILGETGRLLPAFLLGSAVTMAGSALAMTLFPLGNYLGGDGWKVAAALTARHIGGAVNYMAVSETLSLAPSTFGAGLAADDLILTLYFTAIYALARDIPPDAGQAAAGNGGGGGHGGGRTITVPEALGALSVSATVCYVCVTCAKAWGVPGQAITLITATTVVLATALPRQLAPLVASAEGLAQVLMQVFYATIGASANVKLVVATAPVLFLFSFIALAAHLGLMLGIGHLLGFSRRDLLLASNANIGGPSTVAGMAAAKGWKSSLVPGILTSTLGYAIGTFLGMWLGGLLRRGL